MKKFLSVFLVVVMLVSMVGCVTKDTDTSNAAVEAADYQKSLETNAKVYKKFIKVPDYNGIEVEVDMSILEVTEKEIDDYIQEVVNSYSETKKVTEGVTKKGDVIVLDYEGKKDGVPFSGGTATDAEYTVGSGQFISDLDKGLEGLTLGTEYDIPCKFPDNYTPADLAGKDVVFTVTVTAIMETVVPELTDEWVVKNAEELGTTEKTVEGLRKSAKEYLVAMAEIDYASAKFAAALEKLMGQIETDKYPQKELASLKATYKTNVESEYTSMSSFYTYLGINDFEAYLKSYYQCDSKDAFDKYAEEQAKKYLLEKMIITIIAVDNKVTISADEIMDIGEKYAANYGEDDYASMLSAYGKVLNAELGYSLASEKVAEIVNNAVSEVPKPTEAPTESESASESK